MIGAKVTGKSKAEAGLLQAVRAWRPASRSKKSHRSSASLRALQEWEQGRKNPSGAARTLLKIAGTNPKAWLAVAND